MTKNKPEDVDVHVGERIRFRRIMIGTSQQALATELGVTFQQVQKYEKGTNRIGASRLFAIAKFLQVPVMFFFEGAPGSNELPGSTETASPSTEFMTNKDVIKLNLAFSRITDSKVRANLIEVATAIAGETGHGEAA